MLKNNIDKVENLQSGNVVSEKLAAAMRGEGTESQNSAVNASGGSAAAWKDSIGQLYHIVGFDLIESEVRVYKRERPREFERLSKDSEVLIADGNVINAKGEETQTPLGEYVMRPISYVAALVTGDRNSISITALQSAVRNKYDDAKVKGKTVLKMSAPTPGDFVAQYGEQLINTDIVLLDYQEKKSGRYTTKICLFGAKEEKK
jgi:hypothetical protein